MFTGQATEQLITHGGETNVRPSVVLSWNDADRIFGGGREHDKAGENDCVSEGGLQRRSRTPHRGSGSSDSAKQALIVSMRLTTKDAASAASHRWP